MPVLPAPHVISHVGAPPAEWWPGVLTVDAAAFGQEAWGVCKPEMEQLLAAAGFALAVAFHGDAIVGFSSAVAITETCALDVIAAEYEQRDVTSADVLPAGPSQYWYWTATCLLPQWRSTGLGRRLLAAQLSALGKASMDYDEVSVIGQMWSNQGRGLFGSFGAVEAGPASMVLRRSPALLARLPPH